MVFLSSALIQVSFIVHNLHLAYCPDWKHQSPSKRRLPASCRCCHRVSLFLAHEVNVQHWQNAAATQRTSVSWDWLGWSRVGGEGCWEPEWEEETVRGRGWVWMGSPLLHAHHSYQTTSALCTGTCLWWLSQLTLGTDSGAAVAALVLRGLPKAFLSDRWLCWALMCWRELSHKLPGTGWVGEGRRVGGEGFSVCFLKEVLGFSQKIFGLETTVGVVVAWEW